ncbi:hypothetical protein SSPO_005390 [Streptomyces antimycoticus]|uniref:Uncharacterized protein n=1 Tax=Streptomyces antimycoticus TaxID=68175 RepID=A0A499UL00_9ACTN|nr:hypothetical protein SSPO_005390 [Streptomyces antimycoticus]
MTRGQAPPRDCLVVVAVGASAPPGRRGGTGFRGSAEYSALDLAAVVIERVVQVNHGGLGRRLRVALPDDPDMAACSFTASAA